jgi:RNA polymerase sigma-70 factor, ECF subfamily
MTLTVEQHEDHLLLAAQRGDDGAFASLVEPRRPELHAHCYRMLASLDDADDAVQEALLRAWRALPRFEARSSLRTWLFRIATRTALDIAAGRARRELPTSFGEPADEGDRPGEPATEIPWMSPYPARPPVASHGDPEQYVTSREHIELAFVAALQHLPPLQRAVYILRVVLAFQATETATMLETSVAAVNSALQRARARVASLVPVASQAAELAAVGEPGVRELAARYARAIEQGDVTALLSLLSEDASWSMPPLTAWFRGRASVARFLQEDVFPHQWRHELTWANGQLAVAGYLYDAEEEAFMPTVIDVLELRDGHITSVTGFLTFKGTPAERSVRHDPIRFFRRFELPERLAV